MGSSRFLLLRSTISSVFRTLVSLGPSPMPPPWQLPASSRKSSTWTEEGDTPTLSKGDEKQEKSEDVSGKSMVTHSTPSPTDGLPLPVLQNTGNLSVSSRRVKRKSARIGGLSVHWARLKKRMGTVTAPSDSSMIGESAAESIYARRMEGMQDDQRSLVDEVVVDRVWSEEVKISELNSEQGPSGSPEKTGSNYPIGTGASDHESLHHEEFWSMSTPVALLRYRVWPTIIGFFSTRFIDEKSEQHYVQENWLFKKSLAMWASLWLIVNWILGCAFVPKSPEFVLLDKIFYFAVAPVLSLPVVMMILYDWPRHRPLFYQTFLIVSIWSWSFYLVLFIKVCGYYSPVPHCQGRDFFALFYYTSALQTIALFGLKLNRFPAAVGALTFFLFTSALIIPLRTTWSRSMINFFVFHSFLIYVHYMRESSERRLYTLRDQLKIQYKATQKAQVNERKASESKRRLTSYVFHDKPNALLLIRHLSDAVINTVLAVQNMEASNAIPKDQEIEFSALSGSLSMMSKVLNDVLDFNRMDSGNFESASRPYAFHQVMRSLFVPLRLATDARGLEFEADLDLNIDKVARRAAYEAMGENLHVIQKHMKDHPDVDGIVTGDETRLRQIVTNLASNACKFTPAGGKLTIKTRLIYPANLGVDEYSESPPPSEPSISHSNDGDHHPLSVSHLSQHNLALNGPRPPVQTIVVRIEVTDTGYGIKPHDMAQSKLFSAFNQTEQGRQQGGKGTGLGLALVRQIVKLTGGRLGVKSKIGEGSTFWVELPLGVGSKTLAATTSQTSVNGSTSEKMQHSPRERKGSLSDSLIMAVEATTRRVSRQYASSGRGNSAMHSIMEQGGLVELVLDKHSSETPIPTRTIGDSSMGPQCPAMPSIERDEPPEIQPECKDDHLSTTTAKQEQDGASRPNKVPLPTPPYTTGMQPISTTPTSIDSNNSMGSENMSASLTLFDASFMRSSPASSSAAVNIEVGMKVLVVDDDPLTRTLMKRILTRLGCHVSVAENGEAALEMITGHRATSAAPNDGSGTNLGQQMQAPGHDPPDDFHDYKYAVVFLDNQMPIMSGLTAVEKLRELGRKDFIVGVTGNALLTDQQEYLDAGVDCVLTKPVLERSLRNVLVLAQDRKKSQEITQSPSTISS